MLSRRGRLSLFTLVRRPIGCPIVVKILMKSSLGPGVWVLIWSSGNTRRHASVREIVGTEVLPVTGITGPPFRRSMIQTGSTDSSRSSVVE